MGWKIIGRVQDWSGAGVPFTLRLTPVVGGSPLAAFASPSAVVAAPVVYRSPDGGVDLLLPFPSSSLNALGTHPLDGLSWRVEALAAASHTIESPPSGAPAPAVRPGAVLASRGGVMLPVPAGTPGPDTQVVVPLAWLLLGVGDTPEPDAPGPDTPGALVLTPSTPHPDTPQAAGAVIEGDAVVPSPAAPGGGVVIIDHAAVTPHPSDPGVVVVST